MHVSDAIPARLRYKQRMTYPATKKYPILQGENVENDCSRPDSQSDKEAREKNGDDSDGYNRRPKIWTCIECFHVRVRGVGNHRGRYRFGRANIRFSIRSTTGFLLPGSMPRLTTGWLHVSDKGGSESSSMDVDVNEAGRLVKGLRGCSN